MKRNPKKNILSFIKDVKWIYKKNTHTNENNFKTIQRNTSPTYLMLTIPFGLNVFLFSCFVSFNWANYLCQSGFFFNCQLLLIENVFVFFSLDNLKINLFKQRFYDRCKIKMWMKEKKNKKNQIMWNSFKYLHFISIVIIINVVINDLKKENIKNKKHIENGRDLKRKYWAWLLLCV